MDGCPSARQPTSPRRTPTKRTSVVGRLLAIQVRRPLAVLAVVALVTAFFGLHAAKLTLNTRYDALLPQNAPSVRELHRIQERTNASQTLLVLLEGPDRVRLRRAGDAVVVSLRALGPKLIARATDGTRAARAFVEPRSALYLSMPALERLSNQVEQRWDWEVQKADGFSLDDDDPPPALPTADELRRHAGLTARFPTGYFENPGGTALVVAAHTPIAAGDWPRMEHGLAAMRGAVTRALSTNSSGAEVRVSYAGDLPTALAGYHVVLGDLLDVGATGLGLILLAIVFYFVRARAVLVMGVTISVGLVWTFGLAQMTVGHLNLATAFLVSIVGGNGINVSILYQSRFFEERARGVDVTGAVRRAVGETWRPTIVAALAAAASYGSLLCTDFRAFRDFGIIAAMGMVACWVVKTLMVPPLLVLLERALPDKRAGQPVRWFEMSYGRPFAWLVGRTPRLVVAAGLLVTLGGTAAAARYVASDPLDYDTRTLESNDAAGATLRRAWRICNGILGDSQGAMVVATDTPRDARMLARSLRARWSAAPAGHKPFAAVHALSDFVPANQSAKLPVAKALGARLRDARERGFVDAADWRRLDELVPPQDLATFDAEDLPPAVAAPFTDKRGMRGTLVLVEPEVGTANDVRKLVAFADAYRTTTLPNGDVVHGSGTAVIFADMLSAVARDVPRAVAMSLGLTLAVVVITFRRRVRDLAAVLFALWSGLSGVALYLYFAHTRINFVNFAALPVTFGIGVDYAINVAQRHIERGRCDVAATLRTSGGAVVLCSVTTLLGYLALLGSHNAGIRGLGGLAAVGEVCCLLGGVVLLPAIYAVEARSVRR